MNRMVITVKHAPKKEHYTEKKRNTNPNLIRKSTKEKRISNEKQKQLIKKAKNMNLLRVLYKNPEQEPEVKFISNTFKLKKAIVEYDLEIIPLQNVYIICHNKKQRKDMRLNILLDFYSIAGDIIIVQIDRRTREFKSLTQENILWFTEVLNRRSPNNFNTNIYPQNSQGYIYDYAKNNNFETKLLDILTNINLTLSYLITNNDSEVN